MPSVTRRPRADRAAKREEMTARLLVVTEALLDEGLTFTEISVEQLIQRAGMSRSTFYVYFEDKGALLRAMAADVLVELGDAGRFWWEAEPSAPRETVRASMAAVVGVYRPHARLMAAVVETAAHDPAVREAYAGLVNGYIAEMTEHIARGQAAGAMRTDLRPAETAGVLCWMLERSCHELVRRADDAGADAVVDALTAVMWNTLYEGNP